MVKKINYLFVFALALPLLLSFRNVFLSDATWGDAPYFFPDYVKTFLGEPSAWVSWGQEMGGVNSIVWIQPFLILWGVLYRFLGMESATVIKLIFYLPAIILSVISPVLLARGLSYSKIVQFFFSLVYSLNTYNILLIDGGQIGVVLAYGLFPLSLLFLHKMYTNANIRSFYRALLIFSLLCFADPRIALILAITFIVWMVAESIEERKRVTRHQLKTFFLFSLAVLGINLYWIVPMLKLVPVSSLPSVSTLQLSSLLNSFFLFQPHWYANEFGKVVYPPFYFVGIPMLIFGGLWRRKKQGVAMVLCFLIFAFFAKGTTPPLGVVYEEMLKHIPFAEAFRDSTKFFIPLVLFGGILIGSTVDSLISKLGKSDAKIPAAILLVCYFYIVSLVTPALLGKLHGVVGGHNFPSDIKIIDSHISDSPSFVRVAWFPEHNPFAYHSDINQAMDAKSLVAMRPFASLNTGTADHFNFLHDPRFIDWFRLFGIKYLVFSQDPRRVSLNQEERYDWDTLLRLVESNKELKRLDWGVTTPTYEVENAKPHIMAAERAYIVLGSDDVYEKLNQNNKSTSPTDEPFLFFEDGKWDPRRIEDFASTSAVLVLNETDEQDLTFSLLQKYFISPTKKGSQWAVRNANEYLRWKYELLIHSLDTSEFDYNKGIAFSTQRGERVCFSYVIPKDGTYVLGIRSMGDVSNPLHVNGDFGEFDVHNTSSSNFGWFVQKEKQYAKGNFHVCLENTGGTHVVNVLAVIPESEWGRAGGEAATTLSKFDTIHIENGLIRGKGDVDKQEWVSVNYIMNTPSRYELTLPEGKPWIIFSDSFNPLWQVGRVANSQKEASFPLYSAINGFYYPRGGETILSFEGQKSVRWGLYGTGVTILILGLIFFWVYSKNE